MSERLDLRRLAAFGIVTVLVVTSLAFILSPVEDDWPEGDLPSFESEAQLRNFLSGRQNDRWNQPVLTDETSGDTYYHSETNVQVEGVDELDVVKTDGEHLYLSNANGISIIKAYPANEMEVISTLNSTELVSEVGNYGAVVGLFFDEAVLAVVLNEFHMNVMPYEDPEMGLTYDSLYDEALTTCCLMDVSDPYAPMIISRYSMSGWYSAGRMIDQHVYLLSQELAWLTGRINLPRTGVDGDLEEVEATSIRFDPQSADSNTFLSILALDMGTFQGNFTTLVVGYSSVVYVSADNMYLTSVGYPSSETDDEMISWDTPFTNIFRLHLDGLNVVPEAKGQVQGFLHNQFSLDEFEGVLRVTTCTRWGEGDNRVYTLDEDLQVIGSLTGIAPGETIQSARFMGGTLYLITFLVTDPLFAIDLSDPADPKLLGELVVPGFSSYLHNCGEGLLAGIGQDNWTFKVSLYNVSDLSSPQELDTLMALTSSWSEALWDHKAILFDERRSWLLVPYTAYDPESHETWLVIWVIYIQAEGLTTVVELNLDSWYGYTRCTVIEDVLFVTTGTEVIAWEMDAFQEVGRLMYDEGGASWLGGIEEGFDDEAIRG